MENESVVVLPGSKWKLCTHIVLQPVQLLTIFPSGSLRQPVLLHRRNRADQSLDRILRRAPDPLRTTSQAGIHPRSCRWCVDSGINVHNRLPRQYRETMGHAGRV
jgi:hypothetical protein